MESSKRQVEDSGKDTASLRLENRKSSLENLKQYYIDNLYYTKYNIGIRTVLKRKQHRKERLDGI